MAAYCRLADCRGDGGLRTHPCYKPSHLVVTAEIPRLFVHTLQDMYYAEQQIVKNLPTMIEILGSPELRSAFQHHLGETMARVQRLEQVFKMHDQPVEGADCPAIDGILSEAKEVISDCGDKQACDAARQATRDRGERMKSYPMKRASSRNCASSIRA